MDPLLLPLPIFRGSPVAEVIAFENEADGTPVDLTGIEPFTAQIRKAPGAPLALALTVSCPTPANGQIHIAAAADATPALSVGTYQWDLLDSTGAKWVYGPVPVGNNITTL